MDLKCIHCSELVDETMTRCLACGGDPRFRGDTDVIDLREGDDRERDNADLIASLLAGYSEASPNQRPRWGDNTSTAIELELEPLRLGKHAGADVLPTRPTRRLRRRG